MTQVDRERGGVGMSPRSEREVSNRSGSRFGVSGLVAAVAVVAAASAFSALGTLVARRMVTPSAHAPDPVRVLAIFGTGRSHPRTVRLSGEDSDLPGERYSLVFDQRSSESGHARLGGVLRESTPGAWPPWVERELISVDRGDLRVGSIGRITGWWFPSAESVNERAERISVALPGGPAPAWLFPSERPEEVSGGDHWAIHVHGRGASPLETLRGVGVAARTGRTSLVLSYRGDTDAPSAAHGRYGFGAAEWHDVSAAMAEAKRLGAKRITLFGWSMGATAALLAAELSPHASLIDGLVLDSPALNWPELVTHHARLAHVSPPFSRVARWLLASGLVRSGVPGGIPMARLTPRAFASQLRVPILIHCSPGDTFVPESAALELAELRPDLVTLHRTERGEHVRLWNVDPERWERLTEDFLMSLSRAQALNAR